MRESTLVNAVAAILCTSGTTVRPKGVVHTHSWLIATAEFTSSLGLDGSDMSLAEAIRRSHPVWGKGIINSGQWVQIVPAPNSAMLESFCLRSCCNSALAVLDRNVTGQEIDNRLEEMAHPD